MTTLTSFDLPERPALQAKWIAIAALVVGRLHDRAADCERLRAGRNSRALSGAQPRSPGLNLLTGYAGQVSLGSAAFMAVGAFAAFNFNLRVLGCRCR